MSDFNPYEAPASELPTDVPDLDNDQELANRGTRLGASIIDSIISSALVFPILFFTNYWEKIMQNRLTFVDSVVMLVIGIVVFLAINGFLLAKYGQTVGKKLLNIRIVNHDTGELLPLEGLVGKRLLPLWVVASIPYAGNVISLVDCLMIFREDRRCLHDLIANTRVVKTN